MRFYKLLNEDENHNGLQYHDGLVKDTIPFNPSGSCEFGGIYFTDSKNIFNFLSYGPWIREVKIPDDAKIYKDPLGKKWKADKVFLKPRMDSRKVKTIKELIKDGTDIHTQNDYALRWASCSGYYNVVKLLLENGADIHAHNDYALRWASEFGYYDIVKLLLENGADIHAQNDESLCWAAENGYYDTVKLLLENGADIHAQNDYALRMASRNGHYEIVKLLVEDD